MTGTPHYIAPEILNYVDTDAPSSEYTNAIDVWAVGCITYRLVTGTVPFPQLPSLVRYCADRSRFPHVPLFNSGITRAGSEFIQKLLVIQPEERPSASQALSHTWITSGRV
jgi:serine/threonine protein kinase